MSQRDPDSIVRAEDIARLQDFIRWEVEAQNVTLGKLFSVLLVLSHGTMLLVLWIAGAF